MSSPAEKLLKWYEVNKREMPWRGITDPYKIWLSEVILQQTRVNQGWNYYNRFTEKYPTVKKLAAASEHDILKLWQGLGYYSRARNMHHAAKEILSNHSGKFPSSYESIRALKGVGDYTAAAIASIAYDLPYPVVDGNVLRVYSRFLGITEPIDSTIGKKKIWKAAAELLPDKNPGTYNQAVMELGALCCTPKNPNCEECPLQHSCYAYANKLTDKLPVKQGKTKVRERFLNYLVIRNGTKILIKHRTENDIWKGMYDFPCVETRQATSVEIILKSKELQNILGATKTFIEKISTTHKHILSHQKIFANFIHIKLDKPLKKTPENCICIEKKNIDKYALPRLIDNYISKYF